MKWTRFLKNVQFLGYLAGKGLFLIFIALLLFNTEKNWDMFYSGFVALTGIFNLMASCIVPNQSNMVLQHGMSDTDWTTDQTSAGDSDSDS